MNNYRLYFRSPAGFRTRSFSSIKSMTQYVRRNPAYVLRFRYEICMSGSFIPFVLFGSEVVTLPSLILKVQVLQSDLS